MKNVFSTKTHHKWLVLLISVMFIKCMLRITKLLDYKMWVFWFTAESPESWRWCRRREVASAGQTGEFGVDCSTVWDKDEKCSGSELVILSISVIIIK